MNHGNNTRVVGCVWVVCVWIAAGAVLPACHCRQPAPAGSWNFEDDCIDPLCDFVAVRGTITRTDAFVAGEHAMGLDANALAAHTQVEPWRGAGVSFVGRCEKRGQVRVTVTTDDADAGARVFSVLMAVEDTWQQSVAVLPGAPAANTTTYVDEVRIENLAGVACVLDVINVGPPPGCGF